MTVEVKEKNIPVIVKEAIEKHGSNSDALIPILSEVNQAFGYIPAQAISEMKHQLKLSDQQIHISESQLFSVASFYHMLSVTPRGRHVIRFCESAPCHVMGGRELFQAVKDALKLEPGQTTVDNKWSFITTSCLGVCGVGPVLLVDEDIYGNVKPEQVPEILARYK